MKPGMNDKIITLTVSTVKSFMIGPVHQTWVDDAKGSVHTLSGLQVI